MNANRHGQTASCKRIAAALGAITAILVLGAAPSAIAKSKPVRIKVVRTSSGSEAPDGTITARIAFTAKDPACLSKIPFDNSEHAQPSLLLSAVIGTALVGPFQRLPGRGAVYGLTLPPGTIVTYLADDGSKIQAPATQAFNGFVGAAFKFNPRQGDPFWQRKSKKLGRVICAPKPENGGDFPLGGPGL